MKTALQRTQLNIYFAYFSLFFLMVCPFISTSQNTNNHSRTRLEYYGGKYIPDLRESLPKSPAYSYKTIGFFTQQVNVDDDGQNIVGDAANEPSIAIDPNNPDVMVIGWRQFNTINNNFRQAGYGYTTDGGENWTFPGVIEPGIFRSDPVLDFDKEGNIYYNSLTVDNEDYLCDVFKSTDGGATWDNGVFAQGGDKQWMTIDKTDGIGSGNLYAFWTGAYSICPPNDFTRSVDEGASFEDCSMIPGQPYWGTLDVSAEGALYAGAYMDDHFVVAKSLSAQFSAATMSWDYVSDVDLGGFINSFSGDESPNPNGLLGQTSIAIDKSEGSSHGNIYVLCSVLRFSPYDPLDVMFARSTDDGETWSEPTRINDDSGNNNWQWFGTMSVSPDGRIDVIWLDTRDNPGQVLSRLYYAWSFDAGETWSENVPLSESFDPHIGWPQQNKMGDYYELISDETGANLAWAATFNGEQDVYYGRIENEFVGIKNHSKIESAALYQNFPNPVQGETTIKFRLNQKTMVSLSVLDITGKEIIRLKEEMMNAGIHAVNLNTSSLKSGIYYYRLTTDHYSANRKMMVIN